MKILIISDTHRNISRLSYILSKYPNEYDILFHLGDSENEADRIRRIFKKKVYIIKGNCDLFENLNYSEVVDIGSHRAYLTHGHRENVRYGYDELIIKAKANKADFVFYGHTHVPVIVKEEGITIACPGSLSEPRGGSMPSYIVADITSDGEVHLNINTLN